MHATGLLINEQSILQRNDNAGDAAIANAIATNTKLNITHVAFGDGNGSSPTPDKTRTSLVKEVYRQGVNKYEKHPTINNFVIVEAILPRLLVAFISVKLV